MLLFSKTRIAPTPSGYLHRGNAASFLFTAALARRFGAGLLLRIDDGDAQRYRPQYARHIFDTLPLLGIEPTEGPRNVHELEAVWSQRHRRHLYQAALQQLIAGEKLFACTCSRTARVCTCATQNLDPYTPGAALRLHAFHQPLTVHHANGSTIEAMLPGDMQQFVVWRRDGLPAYQLTSVVDDLHFGIDLIVRGKDLWPSTLAQLALAAAMGAERFGAIRFVHHPLLLGYNGEKLSKSAGDGAKPPFALPLDAEALQALQAEVAAWGLAV